MRRWLSLLLVVLAACTQQQAPPDALVAQMRVGLERSLAAMGEAPMSRAALDHLSANLCWQSDAASLARARDGAAGDGLAERARATIRRIEGHGHGIRPPAMLTWLSAQGDGLVPEQRLLLEACIQQALKEEAAAGAARR
ncbi:MAG: hypothetical protein H0V44_19145 [Planctomycetes bacterium]|nr:hypothetical protein [Planctomycetota bacterium]